MNSWYSVLCANLTCMLLVQFFSLKTNYSSGQIVMVILLILSLSVVGIRILEELWPGNLFEFDWFVCSTPLSSQTGLALSCRIGQFWRLTLRLRNKEFSSGNSKSNTELNQMNYYNNVTDAKENESGTKFTKGWKTTALRTTISATTQKEDNRIAGNKMDQTRSCWIF